MAGGGKPDELEVLEPEPPSEQGGQEGDEASEEGGSASADASEIAEAGGAAGGDPAEGEPAGGGEESAGEQAAAGGTPGSPAGTVGEIGGGLPGEEASALDRELAESLGDFEGELQRQITVLASAQRAGELENELRTGGSRPQDEEGDAPPADQTGQAPGLVMVDDPSQLPPAAGSSSGNQTLTSGTSSQSDQPGGANSRAGSQNSAQMSSRVPGDVGDGSDDDVVARQIREAAMNEVDPVLREKLWEEYRNYKKAIR